MVYLSAAVYMQLPRRNQNIDKEEIYSLSEFAAVGIAGHWRFEKLNDEDWIIKSEDNNTIDW